MKIPDEFVKEHMGKHGLKGHSGLIPMEMPDGTVSLSFASVAFDSDGKVFVETKIVYEEFGEEFDSWERMDADQAEKEGKKIIKCSFPGCENPAVRLDHHHGYMDDMTNCEEHIDWCWKKEYKHLREEL